MSLRYQINIRIFILALGILIFGGAITIWQARKAVHEEVNSSITLAEQLIKIGFLQNTQMNVDVLRSLPLLNILHETRHLEIQLQSSTGKMLNWMYKSDSIDAQDRPPAWFYSLVSRSYPETKYPLTNIFGKQMIVIVHANPMDEVKEAWQETVAFFGFLLLLTCLTFIVVNLVFKKSLKPIEQIVDGLKRIETGHYQQKLPEFSIWEFSNIAKAINKMTDELAIAQQENSALTKHSLEIQEEERQRLAQELHDELGQSLTAIKVMAVTARHPKSDIMHITQSISEICDHLIQVVRSMMYQLHPLILTELGLKAALDDMLKHWKDRNPKLSVSCVCDEKIDTLTQAISIHLFRVIQECLTNIVRHSGATQVSIELKMQEKWIVLVVQDNGKGCDMNKVKSGFGLRGMQERIKTLGGELKINSQTQQGMQIRASIPL